METIQIIILGIIQGITEFLPISSSGHLILVPTLTSWPDQGLLFDMSVHIGTLAAVMLYFHKESKMLTNGCFSVLKMNFQNENAKLTIKLAISTIPLIIIAPLLKDFIELNLRTIIVIATTSIIFGILLFLADKKHACSEKNIENLTFKEALIYGIFQVIAIIPGTSRSGICMTAGRFLGFSRTESSRYAMLMAIPVLILMGGYTLISDFHIGLNFKENWQELILGTAVSFTCALFAIHFLMKFVEKVGFLPFVIYRIILGIGLFIFIM